MDTYGVKIVRYASLSEPAKGIGMPDQPVAQYNFDRTLATLLNTCFRAGFVLDAVEEPVFNQEARADRAFSWANFKEIPPVLVARLRLAR